MAAQGDAHGARDLMRRAASGLPAVRSRTHETSGRRWGPPSCSKPWAHARLPRTGAPRGIALSGIGRPSGRPTNCIAPARNEDDGAPGSAPPPRSAGDRAASDDGSIANAEAVFGRPVVVAAHVLASVTVALAGVEQFELIELHFREAHANGPGGDRRIGREGGGDGGARRSPPFDNQLIAVDETRRGAGVRQGARSTTMTLKWARNSSKRFAIADEANTSPVAGARPRAHAGRNARFDPCSRCSAW